MNWNDLTYRNKLLIYMYCHERATTKALTIASCIDDAIAYGIAKDKKALSNLFYILRSGDLVESDRLLNGTTKYWLTQSGQDYAKWLIDANTDLKVPNFASLAQPSKTEEVHVVDLAELAKELASIVAQKYGSQPKQNDAATDETDIDALYEQIVELRRTVQAKEEQIANIKNAHSQTCALLDKKTKLVEYYENVLSTIEKTFADAAKWCRQTKQNALC